MPLPILEHTYMLLPNFSFRPDGDIQLGTVLVPDKKTKLPNAKYPLLDRTTRLEPAPELVAFEVEPRNGGTWSWSGDASAGKSGGLGANVPALSFVMGGIDVRDANMSALALRSPRVETSSFVAKPEYISEVLRKPAVQAYKKRKYFPTFFFVTGIKLAYDLDISYLDRKGGEVKGGLGLDLTSVGAPVQTGVRGSTTDDRTGLFDTEKNRPVLLAYELMLISMKRGEKFDYEYYTQHAFLFDGGRELFDDTAPENLDRIWDIAGVCSDTVLRD